MTNLNIKGVDQCDQCGELWAHIDAGFSPAAQNMGHPCGGEWRPAELTSKQAMEIIANSDSPGMRNACESALTDAEE